MNTAEKTGSEFYLSALVEASLYLAAVLGDFISSMSGYSVSAGPYSITGRPIVVSIRKDVI
ncbi:MAG: hypothetical protein COB77_01520 [Gammaproteobacteria bacterium]|nr:MAG: hypothetical protein COB77_01520 [Gammaproteobacteria bacterium]